MAVVILDINLQEKSCSPCLDWFLMMTAERSWLGEVLSIMLPPGRVSGSSISTLFHLIYSLMKAGSVCNRLSYATFSNNLDRSIVKARITNAKTSLGKPPAVALTHRSVKPVVYSTAVWSEEPSVRLEPRLQVFVEGLLITHHIHGRGEGL